MIRINRYTQEPVPSLAVSWKVTDGGTKITFRLRREIRFSDGSPFSAADVAYTITQLNTQSQHSPFADEFRASGGEIKTEILAPDTIAVRFAGPMAGLERLF